MSQIPFFQPYVAKNVDPLIFRGGNDRERSKHNLGDLGHFTAIVTAKSNKIGCGMVKDNKLEYKVTLSKPFDRAKITLGCEMKK